jgi:hypothetical protein
MNGYIKSTLEIAKSWNFVWLARDMWV